MGIIKDIKHVFETPQARDLLLQSGDRLGVRTYVGRPNHVLGSHFLPPPHFGEHTIDILSNSLKMGELAIQKLITDGSVR